MTKQKTTTAPTKAPNATEKKYAGALKELRPHVTKVAQAMKRVADHLGKADDNRLTAAVHVSEIAAYCETHSIRFKRFCETNKAALGIGYETARKLKPIGDAERAEKGAGSKLLADMRESNRIANAEMRKRNGSTPGGTGGKGAKKASTPESRLKAIKAVFDSIADQDEQRAIVAQLAKSCGLTVSERKRRTRTKLDKAA